MNLKIYYIYYAVRHFDDGADNEVVAFQFTAFFVVNGGTDSGRSGVAAGSSVRMDDDFIDTQDNLYEIYRIRPQVPH